MSTTGEPLMPREPEVQLDAELEEPKPLKLIRVVAADMEPYGKKFGFWVQAEKLEKKKKQKKKPGAWFMGEEPEEELPLVWVPDDMLKDTMPLLEWQGIQASNEMRMPDEDLLRLKKAKAEYVELHEEGVKRWFQCCRKVVPNKANLQPEDIQNMKQARAAASEYVGQHTEHKIQQLMLHEPSEEELAAMRGKAEEAIENMQPKKGYSQDFDYKYKYKYAYKYVYTD